MEDFNKLIERSYLAIKERGLIKNDTIESEFYLKMKEELLEICNSFLESKERYIEECIDLATVCLMQVYHLGFDVSEQFIKVIEKNEKRANKLQ